MVYCINPKCSNRLNDDRSKNCKTCETPLLIQDRYQLIEPLRELHKSPYIEVFEVYDLLQEKFRVLKVLKVSHAVLLELLKREAKVLTWLNHPGVPKVDVDGFFTLRLQKTLQLHCLAVEKIEGQDLEKWLQKQGILSPNLALAWLRQITEILDRVHHEKLIHRDIKPANIIRKSDGSLVLIDFGAVRQVTETVLGGGDVTSILTPGYAAPEQYKGKIYPQSDFFALGRTCVHLLTGQHPSGFQEDKENGLIWRHQIAQEMGGTSINPLLDFIDELMAYSWKKRPANTRVLLKRLEQVHYKLIHAPDEQPVTLGKTMPLPPQPRDKISRVRSRVLSPYGLSIASFLLAIALFPLGIWVGRQIEWQEVFSDSPGVCRLPAADVTAMDFSPTGSHLVSTSSDASVRLLDVSQGLEATETDCQAFHSKSVVTANFSPDGQYIATTSLDGTIGISEFQPSGQIQFLESLEHRRHPTRPPVVAAAFAGSNNIQYLATGSSDGSLKVWDIKQVREEASLNAPGRNYVTSIDFSRDGIYLATTSLNNVPLVWQWQDDEQTAIALPQNNAVTAAFNPAEDRYLATAGADGTIMVWDIEDPEEAIAQFNQNTQIQALQFSPNGRYIAVTSFDDQAQLWDWQTYPEGQVTRRLAPQNVRAIAFTSRNGEHIAVASADDTVQIWQTENLGNIARRSSTEVTAVLFDPVNPDRLAMVTFNGAVELWQWR